MLLSYLQCKSGCPDARCQSGCPDARCLLMLGVLMLGVLMLGVLMLGVLVHWCNYRASDPPVSENGGLSIRHRFRSRTGVPRSRTDNLYLKSRIINCPANFIVFTNHFYRAGVSVDSELHLNSYIALWVILTYL